MAVPAQESAQVAQLITSGQSGPALEIAKQIHKRYGNPASEALLTDAYVARIFSLMDRNLEADAKALTDLVWERYRSSRARLGEVKALFAARKGELDALLAPLEDPSLPPEKRASIAHFVRCHVSNLSGLSNCRVLRTEHPLRTGAAALVTAFDAVTSGPVEDATLALPDISRQSPLASWKMLLWAIASFYRHDDQLCDKYLKTIEPDSAAARLIPALRALMGQKAELTPTALLLVRQIGGGGEALRAKLQKLEQVLEIGRENQGQTLREIRDVLAACKQSCPDLEERLKQHIWVRAIQTGLKKERLRSAADGGCLKNAYYWRLAAHAFERPAKSPQSILYACSLWEEFRRHALNEHWFPAKGPEVSTLYLHMLDLLERMPEEELLELRRWFSTEFRGHADDYQDQPPSIRALMLPPGKHDLYFLRPEALLERTCEAAPCAENFQRWLDWAKRNLPFAQSDSVAWRWRAAFPNEVQPLLHLMESSEKSNAFRQAFKYMQQAEQLDGLNPDVRRARLRLLVSLAKQHLRRKNLRLADKELCAIEALPQAQQGDRPAFVAALRWVSCKLWNASEDAAKAFNEVARLLNSETAAQIVVAGVARACKFRLELPPSKTTYAGDAYLAASLGRACALGEDMGIHFEIPTSFSDRLLQELSASDSVLDASALMALGEAALRSDNFPLAYAISAAGLTGSAQRQSSCLYLRARALPVWDRARKGMCAGAAAELARRQRDLGLLHKIGEWRAAATDWFDPSDSVVAMSSDQINCVIEQERNERAYPTSPPEFDSSQCDCPACCLARGEMPRNFEEMLDEFGPRAVAQAMCEVLGIGGRSKRTKKRQSTMEDDIPF